MPTPRHALASAADKIIVPRTGGVGSVGVIVIHCDWSQHIADDGLKVTIVKYGDRKAETNPYVPLTEEALTSLQVEVDEVGQLFVSTVARNRGISESAIRDTQAAPFLSSDGVRIGLADEVKAPDAAFRDLLKP